MPLPDSDGTFSSSDDENDPKDIHLPIHPKPELDEIYELTVISAMSPSNFYVSEKFHSFLSFIPQDLLFLGAFELHGA